MKKTFFLLITLSVFYLTAFSQNTWQQITPICDTCPPPLQGHSMVSFGNKVYLFGGMNNDKSVFNNLSVYDTEQEWIQEKPLNQDPPARYNHKAVNRDNNKMYVFFGKGQSGVLNDIWEYDTLTKMWTQIIPASTTNPAGRHSHSLTLIGNKLWVFGGRDNNDNLLNDLWAYDITTNQWASYPVLPWTGLSGHVAVHDNNNLYVYLGYDNSYMNTEIFKYNIDANQWTVRSPMGSAPYPVAGSSCVQVDNNTAFIFGGSTGATSLDACYKWDIVTSFFTQIASGPEVSYGAAALINSQTNSKPTNYKEIVFFGGEFEGTINDDTWIYTTDIEVTSGIKEVNNSNISIYPNPTTQYITIELNEKQLEGKKMSFQLCDIQGRVLKSAPLVSSKNDIDVSDFSIGIYFVYVLQGDSLLYVFKHVKE